MTLVTPKSRPADETDARIGSSPLDPGDARETKSSLRDRSGDPDVVRLTKAPAPDDSANDDVEDMWDNVPV